EPVSLAHLTLHLSLAGDARAGEHDAPPVTKGATPDVLRLVVFGRIRGAEHVEQVRVQVVARLLQVGGPVEAGNRRVAQLAGDEHLRVLAEQVRDAVPPCGRGAVELRAHLLQLFDAHPLRRRWGGRLRCLCGLLSRLLRACGLLGGLRGRLLLRGRFALLRPAYLCYLVHASTAETEGLRVSVASSAVT